MKQLGSIKTKITQNFRIYNECHFYNTFMKHRKNRFSPVHKKVTTRPNNTKNTALSLNLVIIIVAKLKECSNIQYYFQLPHVIYDEWNANSIFQF